MPKRDDTPVVVTRPTAAQYEDGTFPAYARLVIEIPDAPSSSNVNTCFLSDKQAWSLRDQLAKEMSQQAGRSIMQQLEGELDVVLARLMGEGEPSKSDIDQEVRDDLRIWGETRGQAQGLALAVSLMRGCSVEEAKAQAMERWDNANVEV